MLMLPFGNDQVSNSAKARREGFGLKLDWNDADEQKITSALNQLLENPKYNFIFFLNLDTCNLILIQIMNYFFNYLFVNVVSKGMPLDCLS